MQKVIWFIDIDGCLSAGKFQRFDLGAMQELEALVKEKNLEVVITTGRSISYLEALGQVMRLGRFAIGDHGSIIYDYKTDDMIFHPLFTAKTQQHLARLHREFSEGAAKTGKWKMSHGKEGSISLVGEGCDAMNLHTIVKRDYDTTGFDLHMSGRVLDISPSGVNKWTGVQNYLKHQYAQTEHVLIAAIGDSHGDLPLLSRADIAACPNNAHADIKAVVNYVSPQNDVRGVIDILQQNF